MGQASNVHHNGIALGVAAKRSLERTTLDVGQHVSKIDRLRCLVGNLNAHERGARDGCEDAHRAGGKRERNVILEVGDLAYALALAHLDLERGDRGTGNPTDHARGEAELL